MRQEQGINIYSDMSIRNDWICSYTSEESNNSTEGSVSAILTCTTNHSQLTYCICSQAGFSSGSVTHSDNHSLVFETHTVSLSDLLFVFFCTFCIVMIILVLQSFMKHS